MKTVLRKVAEELMYFNQFEEEFDMFGEDNIIIAGNTRFNSYGNPELIDIIEGNYYDDELGYDYEILAELEKVTGRSWDQKEIHGYSQGEWNNMYYIPGEITEGNLEYLEALYFGKYDEFSLEEEGELQYYVCVTHSTVWRGKEAICKELGLDPADTQILMTSGYTKLWNYKEME